MTPLPENLVVPSLPPIRRARRQRLPVERISVEGFGAEVQVGGAELFGLAQEKVSTGFQVEVQALEQGNLLSAGELGQHVHAENAVEASDVAGAGQIHAIESHQAAQARLDQQVRGVGWNILRTGGGGRSFFCFSFFFYQTLSSS